MKTVYRMYLKFIPSSQTSHLKFVSYKIKIKRLTRTYSPLQTSLNNKQDTLFNVMDVTTERYGVAEKWCNLIGQCAVWCAMSSWNPKGCFSFSNNDIWQALNIPHLTAHLLFFERVPNKNFFIFFPVHDWYYF